MKRSYLYFALAITVLIFLLSAVAFIGRARHLHRSGALNYPRFSRYRGFYRIERPTSTPANTEYLRAWMTFDYVNKSFGLPPDYLKLELNIADRSYPNLLISGAAKEKGEASAAYLEKVKAAVNSYRAPGNSQ